MSEENPRKETERHTTPVDLAMFEGAFGGFISEHAKEHEELNAAQESAKGVLESLDLRIQNLESEIKHRTAASTALAAAVTVILGTLSKSHPQLLDTIDNLKIVVKGDTDIQTNSNRMKGVLISIAKTRMGRGEV